VVKAEDLGASFIKAVTDLLCSHTMLAARDVGSKEIVLAGGVSANSRLRRVMLEECNKEGIKLYMPELKYCGDNAAMIASQGYYEFLAGKRADMSLNAVASKAIDK
jgi:N6-L-threonylcarbamoyladenine synthase